jgi:nanoRNase/pAp phosphatase (c-di-AMP/oligoRNAs hydrolase)
MDNVGLELAGDAEALAEAEKRGRELATGDASGGHAAAAGVIIVEDEWQRLQEIPF